MTKERLAQLIYLSGLSQKAVGLALNRSETAISLYLSGERQFSDDWAEKAESFLLRKIEERKKELNSTAAR